MIISRKKYERDIAEAAEKAAYEARREVEERTWNNERVNGLQEQINRLGETVNELCEANRKKRGFRGLLYQGNVRTGRGW